MPKKSFSKVRIVWVTIIIIALFLELGYFVFRDNINKIIQANLGKIYTNRAQKLSPKEEEQKVLDCAKKIDQSKDLSSLSDQEVRDCLFVGCGNFFR